MFEICAEIRISVPRLRKSDIRGRRIVCIQGAVEEYPLKLLDICVPPPTILAIFDVLLRLLVDPFVYFILEIALEVKELVAQVLKNSQSLIGAKELSDVAVSTAHVLMFAPKIMDE